MKLDNSNQICWKMNRKLFVTTFGLNGLVDGYCQLLDVTFTYDQKFPDVATLKLYVLFTLRYTFSRNFDTIHFEVFLFQWMIKLWESVLCTTIQKSNLGATLLATLRSNLERLCEHTFFMIWLFILDIMYYCWQTFTLVLKTCCI